MTNNSYNPADKLNPNFQLHAPQGRVQAHDQAFFARKYAFMQKPAHSSVKKKR